MRAEQRAGSLTPTELPFKDSKSSTESCPQEPLRFLFVSRSSVDSPEGRKGLCGTASFPGLPPVHSDPHGGYVICSGKLGGSMTYTDSLTIVANWATILTAAIATAAYGRFVWGQRRRRKLLEAYLRDEKLSRRDEGRRSVIHLMANLAMTEAEILAAAFQSKIVATVPGIDENGKASRLLFEYDGHDMPSPRKF